MKQVRSWPHASKVTNDKTFIKIFLAVRPKTTMTRKKGRRKATMAIAKHFAVHANAKKIIVSLRLNKYNERWKT